MNSASRDRLFGHGRAFFEGDLVFRGAFRLYECGLERSLRSERPFGDRLRAINERVRKWASPDILHWERLTFEVDHEGYDALALVLDRAFDHIARDTHPAPFDPLAHGLELRNGLVIGLALFHTGNCEGEDGAKNDTGSSDEFEFSRIHGLTLPLDYTGAASTATRTGRKPILCA